MAGGTQIDRSIFCIASVIRAAVASTCQVYHAPHSSVNHEALNRESESPPDPSPGQQPLKFLRNRNDMEVWLSVNFLRPCSVKNNSRKKVIIPELDLKAGKVNG
jgi:hypothetical protein